MGKNEITNIDEYIALFADDPKKTEILNNIRKIIAKKVPQATEKISWQMPTFYLGGNLIHFAMAKNHLGLYPGSGAIESLSDDLKDYKTSKGAVQIPLDKPLPKELIENLIDYNIKLLQNK